MKYVVNVADRLYEVEIEDIYARPVIARVDGQEFSVNPMDGTRPEPVLNETIPAQIKETSSIDWSKQPIGPSAGSNELTAPLPGTVIEVFVKPEERIEAGQVVLIIEAMKMKNSIRSTRAGKISEVLVSAGQTVAHKQALVRFEE